MKTINISEETYEAIKDQLKETEKFDLNELVDLVGKNFFIRTLSFHYTGHVEKIVGKFLKLTDASWIADSGRFMNAIKEGKLDEVEPIGDCMVSLDSVVDVIPWNHDLPVSQK